MADPATLSDRERQLLLGGILGDGSLKVHAGYANARYAFRHSVKQKEYFDWKADELVGLASEKCRWEQPAEREDLGGDVLRFQTLALPRLTDLHRLTHEHGEKRVRRRWLNQLAPLGLAVWWLDDGSIVGNGHKGVLCTDSFGAEQVAVLVRYLRVVWKVQARWFPASTDRPHHLRLALPAEQLGVWLRLILPAVPPLASMVYKVLPLYRDQNLQERWISEVSDLAGFDRRWVAEVARDRKARLKAFQTKAASSENDIVQPPQ